MNIDIVEKLNTTRLSEKIIVNTPNFQTTFNISEYEANRREILMEAGLKWDKYNELVI